MTKNTVHDEDCWEIIFRKLDYSHDIASVSLVCKEFLCITNRLRLSLRIPNLTAHLLPKLLERFHQVKSIEIVSESPEVCNDIICQISRSGLKHFEALDLPNLQKIPREALRELAMNMNGLKKLTFSLFCHCDDVDLIALGDWFPTLEELSISGSPYLTDSGLEVLASKLKRLTKISLYCIDEITDQSIVSIASNCANLTDFGIYDCRRVTENGLGFLLRHCSMLTSFSLQLMGKSLSNVDCRFTIANSIPYARNLEEIRFRGMSVPDEVLCSVAKSCPMVKKMYLNDYNSTNSFTFRGLAVLLRSFSSLRDFTFGTQRNSDKSMLEISQHLRGLTQLDLSECCKLGTASFFILTKTCTSLKSLTMCITEDGTCENSKVDLHHNYQLEELTLYVWSVVKDRTLVSFVSVSPNLQRLSLKCCLSEALTNEGIVECLKICPKLWYLDVFGSNVSNFMGPNEESKLKLKCIKARYTAINDEALEAIGKRCPDLESLDIVGCKFVTNYGLKMMVSKCEKLREIDMSGCPNVSIDLLELLVKSRPSLKKIITPSAFILSEEQRDLFLRKGCHVTHYY